MLAGDPSLSGGSGDDLVDAFNEPAFADVISCGPGNDRAYADETDLVADCEEVIFRPHPDAWDRDPFQPALLRG